MAVSPSISVVIPTLNEEVRIAKTIASAAREPGVEIVVADGGSRDRTVQIARQHGALTLSVSPGRARQMNAGANIARGEYLLFLHADTSLPTNFTAPIYRLLASPDIVAGAFRLGINGNKIGFRCVEIAANWRTRYLQLPYGDQGLFLRAQLFFELGGYSDLPIMEDYHLVRRLTREGRIALASETVSTSSRRWEQFGIIQTTLLNQVIVFGYLMGVSPCRLRKWYQCSHK